MTELLDKCCAFVYAVFFKYFILISFVLASLIYCYFLSKLPVINAVKTTLGFTEALLCSYIFYFLVVFIPQNRRIKHIKNVTLMAYHDFKREIISHFCAMTDDCGGDVELLFNPTTFRKHFSDDKWYQIANASYENKGFMKEWQVKAQFLREEIMYLLNAVEHTDDKAFTSLKVLCWRLQELESVNLHDDYEGKKSLMRFFWAIFAGWSFISGYIEYDHIEEKISRL